MQICCFYVHFLWLQPGKSIRIRRQRFFFCWWLQSPCKTVFEFAKWELMKIQRTTEHRQTECERCDALRCFAANSAKTKGKCNKADDRFYFNDLTGLYKICNRFTISKNRCTWFGCFFLFLPLARSLSHFVSFLSEFFHLAHAKAAFFPCERSVQQMQTIDVRLVQYKQRKIENISDDLWFAINLNKLILFVLSVGCVVHRSLDTNMNARDLFL